jgi:hypothetical protein
MGRPGNSYPQLRKKTVCSDEYMLHIEVVIILYWRYNPVWGLTSMVS